MRGRFLLAGATAVLAALTFSARPVSAQDEDSGDEYADEDEGSEDEQAEDDYEKEDEEGTDEATERDDDEKKAKRKKKAAKDDKPDLTAEEEGEQYLFVGLRYRGIIVPKFVLNWWLEGGRTVYVNGFGPELGLRKDNFEIVFSAWYASYRLKPTPIRGIGEDRDSWEIIESKMKALYFTADFLWSSPISSKVAITYGLGAGLAPIFGKLYRAEAYYPGDDGDPDDLERCESYEDDPQNRYCDDGVEDDEDRDEDLFVGDYTEPSWANGGSKPFLFPWLALQTGVRYKPHPNFVARLDVGMGMSGFFFGLGADYGL